MRAALGKVADVPYGVNDPAILGKLSEVFVVVWTLATVAGWLAFAHLLRDAAALRMAATYAMAVAILLSTAALIFSVVVFMAMDAHPSLHYTDDISRLGWDLFWSAWPYFVVGLLFAGVLTVGTVLFRGVYGVRGVKTAAGFVLAQTLISYMGIFGNFQGN